MTAGVKLDLKVLAEQYVAFEARRLSYISRPEALLEGKPSKSDKDLFKYIEAFKTSGGLSSNINARHRVLAAALRVPI